MLRKRKKRRKNKMNEKTPVFSLTKEQFIKKGFKDKHNEPVNIGDKLKNQYGVMFEIKHLTGTKRDPIDEVVLQGYNWPCNMNAICVLEKIK